ncbi:MAG: hypothetical protein MHM6MM_005123, partial [Cercozoa sp. M6MM]
MLARVLGLGGQSTRRGGQVRVFDAQMSRWWSELRKSMQRHLRLYGAAERAVNAYNSGLERMRKEYENKEILLPYPLIGMSTLYMQDFDSYLE